MAKEKDRQANGSLTAWDLSTLVYFVEPHSGSPQGIRELGHHQMLTVPRQGETVTLPSAHGSEPMRYKVLEIIHHLPPYGIAYSEPVAECTCVVNCPITPSDLERVIDRLSRLRAQNHSDRGRGTG